MKKIKKLKLLVRIIRYRIVCMTSRNHSKWLRKHNVFGMIGQHVLYQTHHLPNNPKLIKIHDNVRIAANVVFYEHDVINSMFSVMDGVKYPPNHNVIEILDNCFIGGNSVIVGPVRIGPNSIVAAGSVVVKDVPSGAIVGGNPAKVIGSFDALKRKRYELIEKYDSLTDEEYTEKLWSEFEKNHSTELG